MENKYNKPKIFLSGLFLAILLLIILPGIAMATVDDYEPDNVFQQAILIPTNGTVQSHTYEPLGDNDWYKFDAVAGTGYLIESTAYTEGGVPYFYLYEPDGTTYINSGGPKLYWTAPATGTYFIRSNEDNGIGVTVNYNIMITKYNPASIQGVLTGDNGTPLNDVLIYAYDSNGIWLDYTFTDAVGNYSFQGIPPGFIKFWIDPGLYNNVNNTKYLNGFYNNKLADISLADPILIFSGSNIRNLQINQSASISGKVTGSDGIGLPNILVSVLDINNNQLDSIYTDVDGTYTVSNYIPPGSYKIKFDPYFYNANNGDSGTGYLVSYYNNKSDFSSADTLLVSAVQDISGINTQLSVAGSISGIITDANGAPLPYVNVYVYDINYDNADDLNNNNNYLAAVTADAGGNYTIRGLPTGIYKVKFDPAYHNSVYSKAYLPNWYNNQPDFTTVNPVIVTNGTETSGINAQLQMGTISGTVTDNMENALSGVNVYIYDESNTAIRGVATLADGSYSFTDLPPGKYKVKFDPPYPNLNIEFNGSQPDFEKADYITIAPNEPSKTVDAQLKAASTISGTVTSHIGSTPLANVYVYLFDANTGAYLNQAVTDANGNYSFSKLWPGNYKLFFNVYINYDYLSAYYTNPITADVINVSDFGQTLTGDVQLYKGGTITGHVVGTDNVGLSYLTVRLYKNGTEIRTLQTDINGDYSIGNLEAGDYTLVFDPYWYNPDHGTNYISTGTFVHLDSEQTTIVNQQQLITGGTISGTVKGTDGTLFPNVFFAVYNENEDYITTGLTDALGQYTINYLNTGMYKITFYIDPYSTGYLGAGTSVFVTTGQQITNDIILTKGGVISGKVTGKDGITGLPGVTVQVWADENNYFYETLTAEDGTYSIKGLSSGDYKISIDPYSYNMNNSQDYLGKWYNNGFDWNSADYISVITGQEVTGKNVQLISGGTIKGRVTDVNGNGIAGLDVVLYNLNDAEYNDKTRTITDSDGNYQIQGIEGSYKVHFDTDNINQANQTEYVSKWYNSTKYAEGYPDAETVTPKSGNIVTVNDQLELGGTITGNLMDSDGNTVPYAEVKVYDLAGRNAGTASTDENGNYAVRGIRAGLYKVKFFNYSSAPGWYYMKSDFSSATQVLVMAGQETSFVNNRLQTGGIIKGKVTDTGGTPLGSIFVRIYGLDNQEIAVVNTDSGGNYQYSGLPSGSYKIKFESIYTNQNYLPEWYNNKTDSASAVPVQVTDNQTVSGIDAQLEPGASISGNVTGPDGTALFWAIVYVYDIANNVVVNTQTDVNGNYTVNGLSAGLYKLKFNYGSLPEQWYSGNQDFTSATPVVATAGQNNSGINIQLKNGTNITGIVKNAANEKLPNILISFFDENNNPVSDTITDNSGSFTSPTLFEGNYKIKIDPSNYNVNYNKNYTLQWYNNQLDYDTADSVTLTAGQNVQLADIQLAEGGNISGKVTDPNNVNLTDVRVSVYDAKNKIIGTANTDSNGTYIIKNLPIGTYKLKFDPTTYNKNNKTVYLTKWYNDKMAFSTANAITVTAGQTIANINLQLTTTPPEDLPALMAVDTPANNSVVSGITHISGWALHSWGVSKVEILKSDNTILGNANLGISKPTVDAAYPGYPDEGHSGFDFILDTVKLPNGPQVIRVKATAANGDVFTRDVNVNVYNASKIIATPESSSDCTLCHSKDKLKFTVAKVNKDFNCLICHQPDFLERHDQLKPVYNSVGIMIGRFRDGDSRSYEYINSISSNQLHQEHSDISDKNVWYILREGDDTPCEKCHGKKYNDNTINKTKTDCVACHKNEAQVAHSTHGASILNLTPVADWAVDGSTYKQISNWTCVSSQCHGSFSAPKIINENGTQLCVNCHNTTRDGYAIDKSGHGNKDNNVIHSTNYVNSNQSHDLNCSQCHTANVLSVHANISSTTYDFNVKQCTTCHSDQNTPKGTKKLNEVIKSADLAADTNKTNCDNCHNVHYNKRDVDTKHTVNFTALNGLNCNDCHNNNGKPMNVLSLGHAGTIDTSGKTYDCVTCHSNSSFQVNGVTVTQYIATVMDSKRNGVTTTTDCATCHQSIHPNNEANHTISYPVVDGQNCNSCHQLNNNNQNSPMNIISSGHVNRYDSNRNQMDCGTCHNNTSVKQYINSFVSNKLKGTSQDGVTCAKCHTLHQDYTKLHTSTYVANKIADCTSCHANKLYEEHANRIDKNGKPYNCDTCHKSTNTKVAAAIKNKNNSCDACHVITHNDPQSINPIHEASTFVTNETFNCAGCHSKSLSVEHLNRVNPNGPAYTCDTCHKDPRSKSIIENTSISGFKINTAVVSSQLAVNSGKKSMCDACHTVHEDTNDAHYKQYNYDKKATCTGCHKIHPKNIKK